MELTEAQRRALDIDRSLCVSAGAGAGKTKVLVDRYIRLLEEGASISQILALTFTEKAAAEMKERVRRALAERSGDEWGGRLEDFNWCNISTFHSFCAELIRQRPLESGISPRFTVLDEVSTGLVREEAFQALIRGHGTEGISDRLVRALTLYESWGLWHRLRYLYGKRAEMEDWIDAHRDPERLKRWHDGLYDDMRRSIIVGLRTDAALWGAIRTLARLSASHSGTGDAGQRFLLDASPFLDILLKGGTDDEIIAALQGLRDLKRIPNMGSKNYFTAKEKKDLNDALDLLKERLEALRFEMLSSCDEDMRRRSLESIEDLLAIYDVYSNKMEELKRERNAIDFEDMVRTVRRLVRDDERMLHELRERFRYLLVDEFQDTDPVQAFIVWAVVGDDPKDRLFIVGDPKQSIYGFRNADVVMFQRAKGRLLEKDPDASVHLDVNFRSSPQVVRFVNHVFSRIMDREEREYQFRYEEMRFSEERKDDKGSVELLLSGPKQEGLSEAEMVACRIGQLLASEEKMVYLDKEGKRLLAGRRPGPDDIAILLRSRTHLKLYEKALRDRGIPYHVHKGIGFFDRQEVLDIYNILRFLADTSDDVALYGVLRSPYFGFSDEELYWVCRADGPDIWHRLRSMAESNERCKRAVQALTSWIQRSGRVPVADLLRHIQVTSGIYAVYGAQANGRQMLSNIEKLNAMLMEGEAVITPHQAVDWMDKARSLASLEGEAPMEAIEMDAVKIMTVHAAKGLEFPIVVVPEMGGSNRGRAPDVLFDEKVGLGIKVLDEGYELEADLAYGMISEELEAKEAEESKRLLYVAMTRARDHLILSGSNSSDKDKPSDKNKASGKDKGVRWLELLRSAMPNGCFSPDGNKVELAPDVEMGVLRSKDLEGEVKERERPELLKIGQEVKMLKEWAPLPRPKRSLSLTPTGLKAFEDCPERYVRRYLFGVPEGWLDRMHEDKALRFGNAVHEVMRGRDPGSVARRYGLVEMDIEEIMLIKRSFDERSGDVRINARFSELPFMMKVRGVRLHGAMDRLEQINDGTWTVIDFKTDDIKGDEEKKAERYADQVRIYMLAVSDTVKGHVDGNIYFTKVGRSVMVKGDEGVRSEIESKVAAVLERITRL
ncbi:MAG: UvrD-helicase domain-containing protein [Methanomassiliicoccales archaeon]|nr:MAG: UvrD-helicase domain-containing protein [Methanomassiliicoccales archaeon]